MGAEAHATGERLRDAVDRINRETDAQVRAWPADHPARRRWVVTAMLRRFAGRHGGDTDAARLFCAGLAAFAAYLLHAKLWERRRRIVAGAFEGATPARADRRLPQVSAVVLTRNEASRIRRCLESLRWAGEVIVVDGESQDGTPAIAQACGARVVSRAFSGSYAEERNAGAAVARGSWVLQLDADEVVTERFRQALEAALRAQGEAMDAFKFQRRSVLLGRPMRHGGWVHYIPNLYRPDRVRYTGLVHERLEGAARLGVLEAPIDHYAMEALSPYLDTQNRYTTLSAQELWRERGPLPWPRVREQLTRRPLKIFWKSYVKKQGFREDMHGVVLAILYGWVHFLTWAKYWELVTERRDGSA